MALVFVCVLLASVTISTAADDGQAPAGASTAGEFNALIGQAEQYRLTERFEDARTILIRAESLVSTGEERALFRLAQGLLLTQTDDPAARAALNEALERGAEHGVAAVVAIAAIELSKLTAGLGEEAAAQDYARRAVGNAAGMTPAIKAAADLAEANFQASFGDKNMAADRVKRLLDQGTLDPDRFEAGQLLIEAGRIAQRVDASDLAKRAFGEAAKSRISHIAALGEDEIAGALETEGDVRGAIDRSATVIARAQTDANSNLIFRAAWRRGRLFATLGDIDAALLAYRVAFSSLRALRLSAGGTYLAGKSLYRLRYGAFHQSFVDLLTRSGGANDDQLRLYEARDIIEDLKIDEVEDYFQERCVPANRISRQVSDVGGNTAVIYPIVLPDRVEVLMERNGRIVRSTTRLAQDEIEKIVKIARIDMEVYGRPYKTRSAQIYDILIRPFEMDLKGADTLVFVPDGVFRLLPIAALWDGKSFLVEKVAVATVLGLSLIEAGDISTADLSALVAGATSVEGFAPLPAVEREMSKISARLSANELFDEDFVVEKFGPALQSRPFELVHIATHAQIGGLPSDNFIATSNGRVDMNQIALTLRARSLVSGVPLELVTLSACATASGDDRAPLGLAGIAYRAGARSVLASLWPVFDNATAELMIQFYDELAMGAGRAEALRRAQVSILSAGPANRHPAVWAAFMMVGEWR